MIPSRRRFLATLLLVTALTWSFIAGYLQLIYENDWAIRACSRFPSSTALGITTNIYMISLPSKTDRQERMEILRNALGLRWKYVWATDSTDALIQQIWEWVLHARNSEPNLITSAEIQDDTLRGDYDYTQFSWPTGIEELTLSDTPIDIWSKCPWSTPADVLISTPYHPIPCAMDNYKIPNSTVGLPEYLILTLPRVACWHSHLSVIHTIANDNKSDLESVHVIFEDDIDVEKDIAKRLNPIWTSLPSDWDLLFLGYCWADEKKYAPLPLKFSSTTDMGISEEIATVPNLDGLNALHPSNQPKCTHAYAMSKRGARRLLLHLRYPPFAYSRAIDQAISWLIVSGRLKSYTVVPSVVIQTKKDASSIAREKTGRSWGETLRNGVLAEKLVVSGI